MAGVPRQLVSAELIDTKDSGRMGAAAGCFNKVIEGRHTEHVATVATTGQPPSPKKVAIGATKAHGGVCHHYVRGARFRLRP